MSLCDAMGTENSKSEDFFLECSVQKMEKQVLPVRNTLFITQLRVI